jgi:3-mercaptopyruvate sulfurtransferase SseA
MSSSSLDGKVLVSVEEALTAHRSKKARFFDGSWFLQGRNGRQEYEKGPRIEGASFFDIDDIAAPSELNPKKLPHMMPTNKLFNAFMDAMGISNDDDIIVYGTEGCVSNKAVRTIFAPVQATLHTGSHGQVTWCRWQNIELGFRYEPWVTKSFT